MLLEPFASLSDAPRTEVCYCTLTGAPLDPDKFHTPNFPRSLPSSLKIRRGICDGRPDGSLATLPQGLLRSCGGRLPRLSSERRRGIFF